MPRDLNRIRGANVDDNGLLLLITGQEDGRPEDGSLGGFPGEGNKIDSTLTPDGLAYTPNADFNSTVNQTGFMVVVDADLGSSFMKVNVEVKNVKDAPTGAVTIGGTVRSAILRNNTQKKPPIRKSHKLYPACFDPAKTLKKQR